MSVDYLGNTPEYLLELEADVRIEIGQYPVRVSSDSINKILGEWELKHEKLDSEFYEFDGKGAASGAVKGGALVGLTSSAPGILSFHYIFEPLPDYGHSEPFGAEEAYYAYWVTDEVIFLMNSDSSMQYKLVHKP